MSLSINSLLPLPSGISSSEILLFFLHGYRFHSRYLFRYYTIIYNNTKYIYAFSSLSAIIKNESKFSSDLTVN